MECYQSIGKKTRRRRKLPDLHQADSTLSTDAAVFWYSYHTALSWIRSNEHVISKCVQLLQIYPNLIQDKSMEHLWDFIESLLQGDHSVGIRDTKKQGEVIRHKREADNTRKAQAKDNCGKARPEIPQISVTESSNPPGPRFLISARHARTPRVHLISRSGPCDKPATDRLLHAGVLEMLEEDFYIRVTNVNPHSRSDLRKDSKRQYIVAESDVCVYLFNDATLEDASCLHDLCIALALKIPIVYIRHHKQQLPKTFSDTLNSLSKGCVTLKDYMHKFVPETHSASSDNLSVKTARVKKKLTPLIVGHRSRSTGELNVNGLLEKHGRSSMPLEIDLVYTLVSNFKNACLFDETDIEECCSKVKYKIHQVLGIRETNDEQHPVNSTNNIRDKGCSGATDFSGANTNNNCFNKTATLSDARASTANNRHRFLDVPDPQDMISAREWGHSGSVPIHPPNKTTRDYSSNDEEDSAVSLDSDARMVSSPVLEQKATTYLIFDQNHMLDGPRKVEFPAENDNAITDEDLDYDDYNETTESPINFHEIDLSREINPRGTPESDTSIVY